MEEVTFRGALDAYVYRPKDKRGFGSAVLVAFIWGIWHLPKMPAGEALALVVFRLGVLHAIVGVPLAWGWRIGGNLLVPAVGHAILDGVREAMRPLS